MSAAIDVGINVGATTLQIAWAQGHLITVGRFAGQEALPASLRLTGDGSLTPADGERDSGSPVIADVPRLLGSPAQVTFGGQNRMHGADELMTELMRAVLNVPGLPRRPRAALIAVAGWCTAVQRDALERACATAGLDFVQLVDAAIATVHGSALPSAPARGRRLVFHLGATNLDVAVVQVSSAGLELIGRETTDNIGTRVLDTRIADHLGYWAVRRPLRMQDFTAENPQYYRAFQRIRDAAERARAQLWRSNAVDRVLVDVPHLIDSSTAGPIRMRHELARREVDVLMNKMLEDALAVCRRLLDRLASQVPEVDELVCSGPGTAPIVVRQRVGTRLGIARLCSADPLTITVRGAAADASTRPLPDDLAFDATQSQRPINAPQRAQTLPRVYLLGSMGQLELGPRTTIGRARDSTIPLDDLHISRDHACIIWDADARTFMLEDLGSRAGTMLNYDPVEPHRHYPLHDGDTIEIALNRFEFREPVDQRGANR